MTKKEIRAVYKQKRLQLSSSEVAYFHKRIAAQLKDCILPTAKIVLSYHPILSSNEINTKPFEVIIQSKIPNIKFVYPKLTNTKGNMEAVLETNNTSYQSNAWKIPEAISRKTINTLQIDIILLPLLAMDKKGYRVGYGKGYYDQFIQRCKPNVYCIGFSYFEPIEKITDASSFDVPLQLGVTPDCVYEF